MKCSVIQTHFKAVHVDHEAKRLFLNRKYSYLKTSLPVVIVRIQNVRSDLRQYRHYNVRNYHDRQNTSESASPL